MADVFTSIFATILISFVYTNDIRLVANVDVNKSAISDHNKIEVATTYRIKEEKIIKKNQAIDNSLRSLNFHAEKKKRLEKNNKIIKEIPWKNICKNGKAIELIEYLLEKLNEIRTENVPTRNKERKKKKIP